MIYKITVKVYHLSNLSNEIFPNFWRWIQEMTLYFNQHNQANNPFIFQLLQSAFNSLPDLIYIMKVQNNHFLYLYANQSAHAVLGKQSILGKTLEEIMPESRVDFLLHFYIKAATYKKCVTFEEEIEINHKHINYETVLTPIVNNEETFIIAVVRDITERTKQYDELMRTNYLLEKNKQRLTTLIDNNSDAIFMLDSDGFFLEANPAMEQMSGYSSFELIGTNFSQILPRTELQKIEEQFNRVLFGETLEYETKIIHKDGSEIFLNIKTIAVKFEGKSIGLYGIARNITSNKITLEMLQTVKMQLESFINDNSDAISLTNLQGEILFVNDAYTTTFGFSKDEVLNLQNPNIPEWLVKESMLLHEQVIDGEKMQNIHLKRQTKTGEILDISMTSSPIFDESGQVTGVSNISRNITEMKMNEREIMRVKEELELVWTHSQDAIFLLSQDGSVLKANPQFYKLFSLDETENLSLINLSFEYQTQQKEEFLTQLRHSKETLQFETKKKSKCGTVIDILATYKPIHTNKILAIGTFKDITAEKRAVTKLMESEERFRNVVENSPDPLLIHDGNVITFMNEAGLKLIRAKHKHQVIGLPVLEYVHPDYREIVTERMLKVLNEGQTPELMEEVYFTLDREKIFVETRSAPIIEHGKTSVLVMIRDITKRRRAEKNLKESEERFRVIAEHSKSVIKILSLKGKVFYISPSAEDTFGYSISNLIGRSFVENVHRDDIRKAEIALQQVIATREPAEIEIRHMHQEGYSIWLNSYFTPILTAEGEVEKIMVILDDISESKRKENKLRKMAFYDYLTGLPNRRLFNERLQQAMLTTEKTGNVTGLLIMDCDKFKQINDTFGHDVGDEVIKEFANRVKSVLLKKDTLSRVGGDEFTIVIPELERIEQLDLIAERILAAAKEPMFIKGEIIQISTSIGISIYPNTNTIDALYKVADRNLYKSKDLGGDTYTITNC